MKHTLNKYKQNLKVDENFVYSYGAKVAVINHIKKEIKCLDWWSVTTSKHINYVGTEYNYKVNKSEV